jgi:hypothetical protein
LSSFFDSLGGNDTMIWNSGWLSTDYTLLFPRNITSNPLLWILKSCWRHYIRAYERNNENGQMHAWNMELAWCFSSVHDNSLHSA